jgi:CRP/FNR family cyclic AMP-dependent transcriptional regulator
MYSANPNNPPISDIERFLSLSERKLYPPNKIIFSEGEKPDTLFYVIDGSVSVILEDEDNREFLLSYLNPGDFFGELSLFENNNTRSASIRTRQKTELAEIS